MPVPQPRYQVPLNQPPKDDIWEALAKGLLKQGTNYGVKQGIGYLGSELGLTDLLKDYLPYLGPLLALGGAAASDNPGAALVKQGVQTGIKEGGKYLANETGLSDWASSQLGDLYNWASEGLGGLLGSGGAAASSLAPSFGVLASDAAPLLGTLAPSYGVLAADAAAPLMGGAIGAGTAGAEGAAMSGLMPAISAAASSAAMPLIGVAPLMMVASLMLQDELADPGGRVSAATDRNYLNQQDMPRFAQSLTDAFRQFPGLKDPSMSNEDLQRAFQTQRTAAKNQQLMIDPLVNQGKNDTGVKGTNFGGMAQMQRDLGPLSVLGTIRAQDVLGKRGVEIPEFETATALQRQLQQAREHSANQAGAGGEYTSQYGGMPSLFNSQGNLAPLKPLTPDQALGMLGFGQANLAAPENTAQMMKLYGVTADNPEPEALRRAREWMMNSGMSDSRVLYSPDIMEKLYTMQPGSYENSLMAILGR